MLKKYSLSIVAALIALLAFSCATPEPKPTKNPDALSDLEKKSEAAEIAALKNAIHVVCALYRVGESVGYSTGCSSIEFALEDEEGAELTRKKPNDKGIVDFPVEAGKSFRVVPKIPSAWSIERIPSGDSKAGDTLRIILRR